MMSPRAPELAPLATRQRGQAMLLAVVLLAVGIAALVFSLATPGRGDIAKDKVTAAALEQAKAALIGFAVSVNLSTDRLGDLPCPDSNDTGTPDAPCTTQPSRIGRLPWKTLGLPDLRDGDGERLWYAVSTNFKRNTVATCTSPGNADCLNSDTRGTITVRNSAGTVIYDGSNPSAYTPSGVIAVIFAPGAVLQRQDTGTTQNRTCTGGSCTAAGVCNSAPVTNTPKCNPINYLDVLTSIPADNSAFIDGSASNGFINGPIRDASNNIVVNDRLIVITYNDIMPALERRVAAEVMTCLNAYAAVPQNNGRYPWAAPAGNWPSFADQVDTRFGRVPDTLNNTQLGGPLGLASALLCATNIGKCMSNSWPNTNTSCTNMSAGIWWNNWKELVFYGVADAYKPVDPLTWLLGIAAPGGCGSCLTIDPPSPTANKKVVVIVAGKRLSSTAYPTGNGQPRTTNTNRQDPTDYLEGTNDNTSTSNTYEVQTISNSFSDYLLYQ